MFGFQHIKITLLIQDLIIISHLSYAGNFCIILCEVECRMLILDIGPLDASRI